LKSSCPRCGSGLSAASKWNTSFQSSVRIIRDLPPDLVPLLMREFQVSGSSVFWWMKRSGILQNTGDRERGRGLVAEGTMRSPVVVVKTPSVNHPASVLQAEERPWTPLIPPSRHGSRNWSEASCGSRRSSSSSLM
jgi:hypothetical protein